MRHLMALAGLCLLAGPAWAAPPALLVDDPVVAGFWLAVLLVGGVVALHGVWAGLTYRMDRHKGPDDGNPWD